MRYAAWVGWDWADREHEICLREAGQSQLERSQVEGTPEALHEWAANMRKRFGGAKVAVCIETSRGAVIWALMGYEHIDLYPVNPKSAASFRDAFYPSGKKDDPVDANVLMLMVEKHSEQLRVLAPADAQTRMLGLLSEHRRKLVQQMVRTTNQLRSNLKAYFPQALELAGDLDTTLACDFLERWPTLTSVQRARVATLRTFYRTHRSRSEARIDKRVALLSETVELTSDEAVLRSGVIVTRTLVRVIRGLSESVRDVDAELAAIYRSHGEYDLVKSLPGAGDVMGPRLAAILGSDRARFESAEELQRLTGVAPVTSSSGGRQGTLTVYRRLKRSKFLHQTIVEWAGCAVAQSAWANAYYQHQLSRGKRRFSILRALAFKLLRILFFCWKNNVHYDEKHHQESLSRHGSPLAKLLAA